MYGTARQAYIAISIELLKEEAPTLYLEDYLYYFNKAISEYMKVRYELFEVNQQLTDDMRAWKKSFETSSIEIPIDSIFKNSVVQGRTVKGDLYRHMLSCTVYTTLSKPMSQCDQRPFVSTGYKATRMTSDIKNGIRDNDYLRPEFFRPYYDIVNNKIKINVGDIDAKRVEISNIEIEYLCQPKYVDLTEEQVFDEDDNSQVLEFSQDVGDEIIKVALKLILERGSNPRLQSNIAVNASISDVSTGMKQQR